MNALLKQSAGRRAFRLGVPLTTIALLFTALAARADTAYTATGSVDQVSAPGIFCPNALGQVLLRASVFTARVDGTDPRLAGRRTVYTDGYIQADGSTVMSGTCYHEIGTWAGPTFTPTAGMWELRWSGVMQTNYSTQISQSGYGSGGAIDGLRLEETVTRTNASGPYDPTVPLLYAGTIKPAPVNTTAVVHNFDGGLGCWDTWGNGYFVATNHQLTAVGSFAGVHTTSFMDSFSFGGPCYKYWTVPADRTLEWRVDLVSLDENATNAAILCIGTTSGVYAVHKGRDFAYVFKWPSSSGGFAIFACDRVTVRNTNVILALALTRVRPNLAVTARVLDKADPNTVLYQRTVVDTPNVDPTLNSAQFRALTGMNLIDLGPEAAGAPFTYVASSVGVFQYTDGSRPAPKAVFDNLELWTSEVPPVGIERAVRLRWPASATLNYAVEGAPTLQGPWLPVQDTVVPGMNQMTVPASDLMQFFRLRQSP